MAISFFRYFWHEIACAALLQRSVHDWHKHIYWYLENSSNGLVSFEVHLDEICDVRKFFAQLVSAKYKQNRRPLSAEFGKEWRHGKTESRRNFVTALKVNAEWLGNALVCCTYFLPPLTTQPCTKSSVQQMLRRRHDYSSGKSCHGNVLYVHKKYKSSASLWVNFNAV